MLRALSFVLLLGLWLPAPAAAQLEERLLPLRQHADAALKRGDYRAAEMLIDTWLPEARRLPDATWQLFGGHVLACRIKLALDKLDDAQQHASQLLDIASASRNSEQTMERAIAEMMSAVVRQRQGRQLEASEHADRALATLRRAHERGRITRHTFEAELPAYEALLRQTRRPDQ